MPEKTGKRAPRKAATAAATAVAGLAPKFRTHKDAPPSEMTTDATTEAVMKTRKKNRGRRTAPRIPSKRRSSDDSEEGDQTSSEEEDHPAKKATAVDTSPSVSNVSQEALLRIIQDLQAKQAVLEARLRSSETPTIPKRLPYEDPRNIRSSPPPPNATHASNHSPPDDALFSQATGEDEIPAFNATATPLDTTVTPSEQDDESSSSSSDSDDEEADNN
ncbi:hypothetical protein BJ508DRAFT_336953, partial [Ascobolus immersus RN42]